MSYARLRALSSSSAHPASPTHAVSNYLHVLPIVRSRCYAGARAVCAHPPSPRCACPIVAQVYGAGVPPFPLSCCLIWVRWSFLVCCPKAAVGRVFSPSVYCSIDVCVPRSCAPSRLPMCMSDCRPGLHQTQFPSVRHKSRIHCVFTLEFILRHAVNISHSLHALCGQKVARHYFKFRAICALNV